MITTLYSITKGSINMAFQQTNQQFGNNNMNQGGEKKKTNFRVGKVYGTDGTVDVSVWNSDKGGCYTILSIKAAVGKDPSTGANVYEQKMSGELPSIFMNLEIVRAFLEGVKNQDPSTLNATIDTKRGSKMIINGQGSSVKLTIENQKTGNRTVTFDAIPVGNTNIHANWFNLIDMVDICYKKALLNKLDPDEFAMVMSGDDNNSVDTPF